MSFTNGLDYFVFSSAFIHVIIYFYIYYLFNIFCTVWFLHLTVTSATDKVLIPLFYFIFYFSTHEYTLLQPLIRFLDVTHNVRSVCHYFKSYKGTYCGCTMTYEAFYVA